MGAISIKMFFLKTLVAWTFEDDAELSVKFYYLAVFVTSAISRGSAGRFSNIRMTDSLGHS